MNVESFIGPHSGFHKSDRTSNMDPGQSRNLGTSHPSELSAALKAWLGEAGSIDGSVVDSNLVAVVAVDSRLVVAVVDSKPAVVAVDCSPVAAEVVLAAEVVGLAEAVDLAAAEPVACAREQLGGGERPLSLLQVTP